MQTLPRNVNPFALMLDPHAVIAQIERSERLEGLHRRVCRPLDKPLLGGAADEGSEAGDSAASQAGADGEPDTAAGSAIDESCSDGVFGGAKRHD